MSELILKAEGTNGQIALYNNRIDITRKGFKAFFSHGMDGTKTIFIKAITAVQFKEAGSLTNGYIQFAFGGSSESKEGLLDATKDENTVMFTSDKQSYFEQIKNYIFEQME